MDIQYLNEIILQIATHALIQGLRAGLIFFFVLFGAKSVLNIIERA